MTRPADPYPRTRRTGAFERRVAAALHAFVDPAAPVLVACSGGPDSLATLIAVARSHPGPVTAAWFDHAMRPPDDVRREGAIVCAVAAALGLPVVRGRARAGLRGESAARAERYRWLAAAARRSRAVACVTGHTRDDQAETVLLSLTRGAGARGASGMAPEAVWPVPTRAAHGLRLLRPLLEVARLEVERYLEALRLEAARDPSNESREYARNRVRHDVVPSLVGVNARAVEHIAAFAAREREDEAALAAWATGWLDEHAAISAGAVELPRSALEALPAAVGRRVLGQAAERLGVRLGSAHIEALLGVVAGRRAGRALLPHTTAVVRGRVLRMQRNA